MRTLTFLCQLFHPDYQATAQLFSDLLFEVQRRGQKVRVICGWPLSGPGLMAVGVPKREHIGDLEVVRVGWRVNVKEHLALRAIGYFSYLGGALWKLLFLKKSSLVLGTTNPPLIPLLLWFASLVRHRRYMLFLLDLYPDGLVGVGGIKKGGGIDRLWSGLNRRVYARASMVLVLGRDMAELIERRYGCAVSKIRYLPHWSQNEAASPASPSETRLWSSLNLDGAFVVQYSGNMGFWHDMVTLVRAANRLREHRNIKFLFIGDGRRRPEAQELAEEIGATNITWLPYQPKEMLNDTLACCHLALISQRQGLQGVAVPCKLYGILASGRGILGLVPSDSEVAMVITEEECGYVLRPDDDEGLAAAILRASEEPGKVREMGERARRAYQEKYTLHRAVERFAQVLEEAEESHAGAGGDALA